MVSKAPSDRGLDVRALKHRNLALIAKWGWRLIHEPDSLWHKKLPVFMAPKPIIGIPLEGCCLRSLWVSISNVWNPVDFLALFKLSNG